MPLDDFNIGAVLRSKAKYMKINRRRFIVLLAALASLPAHEAFADRRRGKDREHYDDHDHDEYDYERADRARRSGDIVPLRDVLESVRKTFEGEIVGIELEKESGLWIYEIKMIAQDGRYIEVYVDAKSNEVLKVEGK